MKSLSAGLVGTLLLLLVGLLPLLTVAAKGMPGGWEPIIVNDVHVQEVAMFAVTEYNKQSHSDLKLELVVGGFMQVVAGVNYKLEIMAKDKDEISRKYGALVWEKQWEHFRELTYFKPLYE